MKKRHTGTYLARKIFTILEDFDLLAKVCRISNTVYAPLLTLEQLRSVIGDNASNMDALVDHLYNLLLDYNPQFEGIKNRLRCFAHILNLVMLVSVLCYLRRFEIAYLYVQAFLHVFCKSVKSAKLADLANEEELDDIKTIVEDNEDEDSWESDKQCEESDKESDDNDNEDLDAAAEADPSTDTASLPRMTSTERQEGCCMLSKASTLAYFVQNSPTRRAQLHDACIEAGVADLTLIRPIKIRWNTHANCLLRTLELRRPVHNLCGNPQYERFLFSRTEWMIMEQIQKPSDVRFIVMLTIMY